MLSIIGSFHPNSDIDRLYLQRKDGGRGIKSVESLFESRTLSIRQHLLRNKSRNAILTYICNKENNEIVRVGKEIVMKYEMVDNIEDALKQMSKRYFVKQRKDLEKRYTEKVMHGYFKRKLENNEIIDLKSSLSQSIDKKMTSHFEGYLSAIHDQEIPTKFLINKRDKDSNIAPRYNNKYCLCKVHVEDVNHIISSCSDMSARYYLPLRHDAVGKAVYKAHVCKNNPGVRFKSQEEPEYIYRSNEFEYWWNLSIRTITKVPHNNKPDLIIWDNNLNICRIVEFSCPSDINIEQKINEKMNNYAPLIRNMQIMYPKYKFVMVPIIVGALGYIP